ncbi:hypothetical protein ACHAWF_010653, partial [Thalassiosira exigua]
SSHSRRSICYSILASVVAAAAFLLCWASEFGCTFVSFTSTSGFTEPVPVHFGIWSYQFWSVATSPGGSVVFETCHRYPSSVEVDAHWKAARAFSTLALVVGGIFLFKNLISGCVAPLRRASHTEAPAFLFACLCQGLSLLLLRSTMCRDNPLLAQLTKQAEALGNARMDFPETCSLAAGANCAVAAVVLWFFASLLASMAVVAERKEEASNGEGGGGRGTEPLIPGENL